MTEPKSPIFSESTGDFLARAWRQEDSQPDASWQAKRDLAEVVHALICATSKSDAPLDALQSVTAALQTQLDVLNAHPQRSFKDAFKDGSYYRDPKRYTDRVFLVGRSNPAVPQLKLTFDGEVATGRIAFDESCVGAPGWAHGGVVATAFDQCMGYRLICSGLPVVTGKLTVHYLQPTALHREVTYRASIQRQTERTVDVICDATVVDPKTGEDTTIGRSEAVFVIIPKGSWKL